MTDQQPLVTTHLQQGVFTITLNRAEKKNSITQAMYHLIREAMKEANRDPQARVILVRGDGGVFTAGNDVGDFSKASSENNEGENKVSDSPATQLMKVWISVEKPIVAEVAGFAVGIGATCLLHCDLVLAARSCRFRLPFTSLGLVPEFGSTYTLLQGAGKVKASHYLLTSELFDTEIAFDLGMVSRICADEQLAEIAAETCRQLAALPPSSLRTTKKLLNDSAYQQAMLEIIDAEMVEFRRCQQSDEHREAVNAFLEKRPADFSRFS